MVNQGDDSQRFGVGKYISEMIQEAENRQEKYEMVIVTIGVNGISEVRRKEENNITYFDIPKPFLLKQVLLYRLSKQLSLGIFTILTDHFIITINDIFHFNSNMQHFLLHKIKENTAARIVYTVHVSLWNVLYHNNEEHFLSEWNDPECFSDQKKNILAEIENCKQADRVVGLSSNTVDDLRKYYKVPKSKLKRVFNGISSIPPKMDFQKLNEIRKNLKINDNDIVFLFAGRVNQQKGIADLVEAFNCLIKDGDNNLKLLVVGDGSLKEKLKSQTESGSEIQFLGYVPQKEVHYYYTLSNAVVIPSLYDQNPYTVLEAMAYKVPMIVTDIDAFIRLKDKNDCLKVSLESEIKVNILALEKTMQQLIKSSELRNFLIKNAHDLLTRKFSSSKMFQDTYVL